MQTRFAFYERAPSSLPLCCASMQGETWGLVLIFTLTETCRNVFGFLSIKKNNCVLNWIYLKGRETHLRSSVLLGILWARSISLCHCSTVVPALVCLVPRQMPWGVKANGVANVLADVFLFSYHFPEVMLGYWGVLSGGMDTLIWWHETVEMP